MALSTDSCEIDTQLSSCGVRDVSALFLVWYRVFELPCKFTMCYRSERSKRLLCREAIHVHPTLLARCTIAGPEPSVRACRVQHSNTILYSGSCHSPTMLLLEPSLREKTSHA